MKLQVENGSMLAMKDEKRRGCATNSGTDMVKQGGKAERCSSELLM